MSEKAKNTISPEYAAEINASESENMQNDLKGLVEDDVASGEYVEKYAMEADTCNDSFQNISVSSLNVGASFGDVAKKIFSHHIINRICVFLLAIAIFALSFAPIVKYDLLPSEKNDTIGFSGADTIRLVISTVIDDDQSPWDPLGEAVKERFISEKNGNLKLGALITAQQDGVAITGTVLFSVVVYCAYFILCTVFLILALKDLLVEIFMAKKNSKHLRRHKSDTMFCVILGFTPVLFFSMLQAWKLCTNNVLQRQTYSSVGLSFAAVLTVIVAFLGFLFVCMVRYAVCADSEERYFNPTRIRHVICIFLVLMMLVLTFVPFVQIEASKRKDNSIGASIWDVREVTIEEYESYYYSYRDFVSRRGAYIESVSKNYNTDADFVNALLLSAGRTIVYGIYIAMEFVSAATLFFAGMLFVCLVRRCFLGLGSIKTINFLKVFMTIAGVAELALAVIFKSVLEEVLYDLSLRYVSIGLGAGVTLMLVCAICIDCVRLSSKEEIEYIDNDYDNADVSYAPYVIRKR